VESPTETPLSASGITPIKAARTSPCDVNTLVFASTQFPLIWIQDIFLLLKCLQLSNLGSTLLCNIGMCVFLRTALCISSYGIPEKLDISRQYHRVSFNKMPPRISNNLGGMLCKADLSCPDGGRVLVPFTKSRVNSLPLDNPTLQFPAF